MSDALLPYFNRELTAIRKLAAEFAQAHPKIAGRLRLSPEAVDDPHVARLLDGVAFLSARVQQRLDDEFPELTDALLGILYPHYLAPFPSCAVAQFRGKPDMAAAIEIPAGFTLDTEGVRGQQCRYRTANPITIWPVTIESARITNVPFTAPANPTIQGAVACLRMVLTTANPDVAFSALGVDRLRFFLRGGDAIATQLFETLAVHTLGIALADGPEDANPVLLPSSALQQVGFAPEEALLPWPARSFSGFRLLSEYFAFPQKFLFLDLGGLEAKTLVCDTSRIEVFFYLGRSSAEYERGVKADNFALGCVPLVNLFPQRCEPMPLDHTVTEYRVVADARRADVVEVWGVTGVREIRQDARVRPWQPFYGSKLRRATDEDGPGLFHEIRRPAAAIIGGSDTFIAPLDPAFDPTQKSESILSIDALCLNRDLPMELPFGGGHPRLTQLEPNSSLADVVCLTPPTPTLRPEFRAKRAWRLVSHLSLSHLSVTGGAEGAAALKEILRLYDLRDTAEYRTAVESLLSVDAVPGTGRVPQGRPGAFCRGLDITLEFEPRAYSSAGLYLLASVLERFLALHATLNSFVRTSVRLRGHPDPVARFPARSGTRTLL